MIIKYYQVTSESTLSSKEFEEGALYVCEDTQNMYFDPIGGTEHIPIGGMSLDEVKAYIDEVMLGGIW